MVRLISTCWSTILSVHVQISRSEPGSRPRTIGVITWMPCSGTSGTIRFGRISGPPGEPPSSVPHPIPTERPTTPTRLTSLFMVVTFQFERQDDGVQPHWFDALHVHSAPVPHCVVGPVDEHVCVQKWVVLSPMLEH